MEPISVPYRLRIDTDRRRDRIRKLTEALYDYLTIELDEMEDAAKAPPPPATFPAGLHFPGGRPDPEELIRASDAVQTTRDRVSRMRESLESMPEQVRDMMVAGAIEPLEDLLKLQETWLSKLQEAMEQEEPAVEALEQEEPATE